MGSNPILSATLRPLGFGWQATPRRKGRRVSPEAANVGGLCGTSISAARNGDVYVGSTNDLRRRFESHRSGHVTSTKGNLPVTLKAYIAVETEANARQLERYFKTGSGKAFARKRFWQTKSSDGA